MQQQNQIATFISGMHIGREETSMTSLGKTYFFSIIIILLAAPIDHFGAVTI